MSGPRPAPWRQRSRGTPCPARLETNLPPGVGMTPYSRQAYDSSALPLDMPAWGQPDAVHHLGSALEGCICQAPTQPGDKRALRAAAALRGGIHRHACERPTRVHVTFMLLWASTIKSLRPDLRGASWRPRVLAGCLTRRAFFGHVKTPGRPGLPAGTPRGLCCPPAWAASRLDSWQARTSVVLHWQGGKKEGTIGNSGGTDGRKGRDVHNSQPTSIVGRYEQVVPALIVARRWAPREASFPAILSSAARICFPTLFRARSRADPARR